MLLNRYFYLKRRESTRKVAIVKTVDTKQSEEAVDETRKTKFLSSELKKTSTSGPQRGWQLSLLKHRVVDAITFLFAIYNSR